MKDLGIRDELDVSRSEVHLSVNLRIVGNGLNQFKCFQLGVGQRRSLGMALGISDVPPDEEDSGHAGNVMEHRQHEEGILAVRLLIIAIPGHWLEEDFGQVRSSAENLV